jgi:hypothetical protein
VSDVVLSSKEQKISVMYVVRNSLNVIRDLEVDGNLNLLQFQKNLNRSKRKKKWKQVNVLDVVRKLSVNVSSVTVIFAKTMFEECKLIVPAGSIWNII